MPKQKLGCRVNREPRYDVLKVINRIGSNSTGKLELTYLKVGSISFLKTSLHFTNRFFCMPIENIKVGNSVTTEEWAGDATMKPADIVKERSILKEDWTYFQRSPRKYHLLTPKHNTIVRDLQVPSLANTPVPNSEFKVVRVS